MVKRVPSTLKIKNAADEVRNNGNDIKDVINNDTRLAEGKRKGFDSIDVSNISTCLPALSKGVREWVIW